MCTEESAILSVQTGYAAWAPLYDDDGNPLTAIEGPAVRDWFGAIGGRRVLDLGCGTGRHTLALLDAGARVIAVDLTPEMLACARDKLVDRPVLFVRQGLPGPLPFADQAFDLVVLGLVAEHVEAIGPALREVRRVLRGGGRCILSALHSDRTAEGQSARYIDPQSGLRRSILTHHRTAADYGAAAHAAGLIAVAERSLAVTPELGERLPRALPYVGKYLGWVACWSRPD